jgi:hypothetical protein
MSCAACSRQPPQHTLQEYLAAPGLAQNDFNACNQAAMQSGSVAAFDKLLRQCATVIHAHDILFAGGGVNQIGRPEPMPHPAPRFYHSTAPGDPRVLAEVRWCKANALYRNVSEDAITPGCKHALLAWADPSY